MDEADAQTRARDLTGRQGGRRDADADRCDGAKWSRPIARGAASRSPSRITTARRGARRLAEAGSLRVRFPAACAGAQEAVLVNTAGGIAGGDRLTHRPRAGGARAPRRHHRGGGEDLSRERRRPTLDGRLRRSATAPRSTWLPQETILFDRARLVALASTSTLAPSAPRCCSPRPSCSAAPPWARRSREGLFADRWRVRRGGRLIFAESVAARRRDRRAARRDRGRRRAASRSRPCSRCRATTRRPRRCARSPARFAARSASRPGTAWRSPGSRRRDGAALRHDLALLLAALGRAPLPRLWLNCDDATC